jgi:hypothetical protein
VLHTLTSSPSFRRLILALGISVFLNIVLVVAGSFVDYQKYPLSRTATVVDALGQPGGAVAIWLAPAGHDLPQILAASLISFSASIFFYALLLWIAISLPAWWRNRA